MAKRKEESQNRIHLLRQSNPQEFPLGVVPQVMTTFALRRQAPDQARTRFRPLGYRARDWGALLRHFESFSGNVSPDYRQIRPILEMFLGEPAVDTTADGVSHQEFYLHEDELADLVHYAVEHGKLDAAKRMLMTLLTTFSLTVTRGNQPAIESQATILANKPLQDEEGNEMFAMTGSVEQSTIFEVVITDADGARVLTFLDEDGEVVNTVSIELADTEVEVQAKVRALGGDYANAVVSLVEA